MRTLKLCTLLSLLLVLHKSCIPENNITQEIAEKNIIDHIYINGSTKIKGTLPTPNQAISFSLAETKNNAFLNEGFDINFDSESEIKGAYVQFIPAEGVKSKNYFDIDLSANSEDSGKGGKHKLLSKHTRKRLLNNSIDVDFTPQMTTGSFCYTICVYDALGNISAPQEVCVTVKNWGGNDALLGTWSLMRTEELDNGTTETLAADEESCFQSSGIFNCYKLDYQNLIFNADGTFSEEIKEFNKLQQETIYVNYELGITKGNWSYDTLRGKVVFAAYYFKDEDEDGIGDEEIVVAGEADVYEVDIVFDGEMISIVSEVNDENADGIIDESYTEFYAKQ